MKPKILIARAIFPEIVSYLARYFEVEDNSKDEVWSAAQLIEHLQGRVGVMTMGVERIDAALLSACPELRICANMFVGYNNFDLAAMTEAGVLGTNAPEVLTETTADLGFALLMATARRLGEAERFLRSGRWARWSYDLMAGQDVHGTTLGVLGMGRIGQAIARRGAWGFGMKVIYHNRSRLPPDVEHACGARFVSKDELLAASDHLLLVLPYTAESHHAIGVSELARMKPTATLINIARGGIVDEVALASALRTGKLSAAGLDVFEGEPAVNPRLLTLPNVVLTPHIGSSTAATRRAMAKMAADNLIGYLCGDGPLTPLNPEVMAGR